MTFTFQLFIFIMFVALGVRFILLFRKASPDTYLFERFFFWAAAVGATLTSPHAPFDRWDLVFAVWAGAAFINVCWDAQIASMKEGSVLSPSDDTPVPEAAAQALSDLADWFETPEVAAELGARGLGTTSNLRALAEYLKAAQKKAP